MNERMKHEIKSKLGDVCIAGDAFAKEMHRLFEVIAAVLITDDNHHCGQDINENQPEGFTYKDLLGRQVISVGGSATRCVGCPHETAGCVKVELVGGDCLCLAKRPVVTGLDDSPKSWEEAYRENMELLRRYTIEQSEANQRLIKAMKKAYEKEEQPVISFDDEDDKSLCDIMAEIKEKADNFMDYLDKVVINPQEQ